MSQMTYGNIKRRGRHWVINCEPQVRSRLKRVFPRVPQQPSPDIDLVASPENSRELLWFLERYPMTMDADTRAALEHSAAEHVQMEQSLAQLVAGRMDIPPFELAKPAREYSTLR